jgi:hypothetical protein
MLHGANLKPCTSGPRELLHGADILPLHVSVDVFFRRNWLGHNPKPSHTENRPAGAHPFISYYFVLLRAGSSGRISSESAVRVLLSGRCRSRCRNNNGYPTGTSRRTRSSLVPSKISHSKHFVLRRTPFVPQRVRGHHGRLGNLYRERNAAESRVRLPCGLLGLVWPVRASLRGRERH